MSSKALLLHKAVQNPEIYHPDFLSGPTDKDMSLASVLERKSSWCYLNTCNNNIYYRDKKVTQDEMTSFNLIRKLFLWICCKLQDEDIVKLKYLFNDILTWIERRVVQYNEYKSLMISIKDIKTFVYFQRISAFYSEHNII